MTGWRRLGIALVLTLVPVIGWKTASAQGQDKDKGEVKLEFKAFNADAKPFYQILVTETEQNMKVMNQEVKQTQKQTFYIEWTPKTEKAGVDLVVKQKIIGVKMNIDIGGNKIDFNSTEEKPSANPMKDFFDALTKLELTLTINPADMTVKDVKGDDEFVTKLSATNPQMKDLLKNILSKEAIKKMAQPAWAAVPTKAVKKGDSWPTDKDKQDSKLDLGAIGSYDTKFKYTYEGEEKGKDKISVTAHLIYKAPAADAKDKLPFVIKGDSKLTSEKGVGTVLFDRAKGRIDSSEMEMTLKGDLKIEVGGMETNVSLTQTQKSSMTTSDENPLEKKKDAK